MEQVKPDLFAFPQIDIDLAGVSASPRSGEATHQVSIAVSKPYRDGLLILDVEQNHCRVLWHKGCDTIRHIVSIEVCERNLRCFCSR